MTFEAKRVTRRFTQTINAAPEVVFPLLCPVREAEWLDDWTYRMIWSQSGLAEQGAVFSTPYEGEADTIWIVTKHDAERREVEFARVTPDSRASLLNIVVSRADQGRSRVNIMYTYASLSEQGNRFIDEYTEDVFVASMQFGRNR